VKTRALVWDRIRDRYFSVDRRTLGLFRIGFGFLLIVEVLRRLPDIEFFYTNSGAVTNHFALFLPMAQPHYFSLFNAFSTPFEVRIAFGLTAFVFFSYAIGYQTKVAQVLSFVLITSLNARNVLLENGGSVVVNVLAAYTMFLPLGERFSIDAMIRSFREDTRCDADPLNQRPWRKRLQRPVVSLAVFAVLLLVACIYAFNTAHKSGHTWRNFQAIHWVMWQNRIATPLTAWLRLHEPFWFSPVLVGFTFLTEGAAPLLILLPWWQRYTRALSFILTSALHLGIAAMFNLGSFSYVMLLLNFLTVPSYWLDRVAHAWAQRKPLITVTYDRANLNACWVVRALARLDVLQRLQFVQSDAAPSSALAAEVNGRWYADKQALFQCCRALPCAPAWRLVTALLIRAKQGLAFADHAATSQAADSPTRSCKRSLGLGRFVNESLIALLLLSIVIQTSRDNRLPVWAKLEHTALTSAIINYPRLWQGWGMFAPNAPELDGLLVVDGVTRSGQHIDPLTGKAPNFNAALSGPFYSSQLWCDYHVSLSLDMGKPYFRDLKNYIWKWHVKGTTQEPIEQFSVYWVENKSPPPGKTRPYDIQRQLLFSATQR